MDSDMLDMNAMPIGSMNENANAAPTQNSMTAANIPGLSSFFSSAVSPGATN